MRKSFFIMVIVPVLLLSACENKEEKRTQLKAQIEALELKKKRCVTDYQLNNKVGGLDGFNAALGVCSKEYDPQLAQLYEELDKLNGVKR